MRDQEKKLECPGLCIIAHTHTHTHTHTKHTQNTHTRKHTHTHTHTHTRKTHTHTHIHTCVCPYAQVHPVVSRLCDPIEGTDPMRIAECLGLDAARFKGAAAAASSECFLDTVCFIQ